MKKVDKKVVLGIIIVALLGALGFIYAYIYSRNFVKEIDSRPPQGAYLPNAHTARIEIDFSNGAKRVFEGELGESYPLLIALTSVAEEGNFQFETQKDAIKEIAGVGGSWRIYKNGAYIDAPLNNLTVKGGDRYMLKHE